MSTLTTTARQIDPLISAWRIWQAKFDDTGYQDTGTAIFENGEVRFRIVVDQGFAAIDIASQKDPGNWFDLSLLLNLYREQPLTTVNPISEIIAFAIAERPRLHAAMTTDFAQTREVLAAAERARFAEMFPGVPIPAAPTDEA